MRVSELILELSRHRQQFGDTHVYIRGEDGTAELMIAAESVELHGMGPNEEAFMVSSYPIPTEEE